MHLGVALFEVPGVNGQEVIVSVDCGQALQVGLQIKGLPNKKYPTVYSHQ
ncbi:hypothetical protein NIES4103_57060 [Nostoc sp. NIES-4103]|nr:hypothetical protein NIES4103_57060 [Nostoc sp. NIES-4103]